MIDNVVYKNLNDFLSKHNIKHADKGTATGLVPSHTRIPDVKTKIYGGSYFIPKEHLPVFYELYYRDVIVGNKPEYLTEKQTETGPLLIDIDLRYHYDVETRQHTQQHVVDLLTLVYLEELKDFLVLEPNKPFPVFVFEKPDVNRLADGSVTKDGIHIVVGVQMDHAMQIMLRERVVEKVKDYWDLPIINSWEAVFDEGISKGTTNWQMFGSRKPNHQRYEWTQHYQVTFDDRDGEIMFEERPITPKLMETLFPKMLAQYEDHVRFEMQPKWKQEWEAAKERGLTLKTKREGVKSKIRLLTTNNPNEEQETVEIRLEEILTQEKLMLAMEKVLSSLSVHEYHVREAHEFAQILPAKYYEPGSHLLNRQVAFALKHTDERLFLSWVMVRSKASDFDYSKIPELYFQWVKHFKQRDQGVTARSIMYWAKQDVPELYEAVKKNTRDYYIEQTLTSPTEFDFALVLYHMYRDKYVCSNLSSKSWFVFKDHRWEMDRGQSLRKSISVEMYAAYQDKISNMMNDMQNYGGEDERYKTLREMVKKATEMSMRLKKTTDKNNIMREAEVLFYDGDFDRNIDSNKWLLCFKNGVVDLKNRVFRNGSPQDYLSKSTNVMYEPLNSEKETKMAQIRLFMQQLFPDPGLNQYMWEHLGSTLIGENKNQCFNIYRGSGSNGKSILTDLMEKALGDYYGTVPVTLVTEKRPGIGGPTSELIQLKGVRYAVMQEPSKDAKINEGMMKQLTGDSKLSGRALYHEQETFMIQFHLVVCTNSLFEINSNDDGTWRRIRICDFLSKFVDDDAPPLQNVPHQFPKDKHLKDKLDDWAEVFVAMLVERAFANQGLVEKCAMVKESSNKYRQGQDHIAAFVEEKVSKKLGGFIKKSELCEQFKLWFQEEEGGNRKVPKPTELYEIMEIKFGKTKKTKDGVGWTDLAIQYQYEQEDADVLMSL